MFKSVCFASFIFASCIILVPTDASIVDTGTTVPPNVQDILKNTNMNEVKRALNESRRIIAGWQSLATRPYMVYLKLPVQNPKYKQYRRWLCGGVIVHEEYILTSAACIEDARNFYVVSGTYKHSEQYDRYNNQCIKNGAKKAIWKCVPKNYVFDGHENDNIRWMNNDIAVVKVDEEFDFRRRVRGCDYIPQPICYNNVSEALEAPDTHGIIAGWGSTYGYGDWVSSRKQTFTEISLLETAVRTITKTRCKRRWGPRYYNIIDNYMICTKDLVPDMSTLCDEKYVECSDVMYSGEEYHMLKKNSGTRREISANSTARRVGDATSGGFCENDHGGPLIAGEGASSVVIGIVSACLVKDRTNKCYGPFLYTSVFRNRVLLDCAIYKSQSGDCSKMYRSTITHEETEMSWIDHPDGPAKNEIGKLQNEKRALRSFVGSSDSNPTVYDSNATSSDSSLNDPDSNATSSDSSVKDSGSNATSSDSSVKSSDSNATSPDLRPGSSDSNATSSNSSSTHKLHDEVLQHGGVVLRSFNETSAP